MFTYKFMFIGICQKYASLVNRINFMKSRVQVIPHIRTQKKLKR